jgi:hypothetical protein
MRERSKTNNISMNMKERESLESHHSFEGKAALCALRGSNESPEPNKRQQEERTPLVGQEQEVLPAGFHPEGMSVEHLSAEMICLVEVALPEQGRALLAHLLSYATCTPQSTLPAAWASLDEHQEREQTALVVVRSLKALAQAEGAPCGPDRYYQLVLVLEALQVLKRRVHRHRASPHEYVTVLSVSLDPHPCSLPTLLRSCSQTERTYANPKVKRLLMQARGRLHATLQSSVAPELHQIVSQMEQIIQQYHAQGLPQAPLLALIQQVLVSVLHAGTPARRRGTIEAGISALPLQTPFATDLDGFSSLMAEETHAMNLSDQGVKAPPQVESFLPEGGKKLPDEDDGPYMGRPSPAYQVPATAWNEQDVVSGKKLPENGKKQRARTSHVTMSPAETLTEVGSFLPEGGKKQRLRSSHVVTSSPSSGGEVGSFLPESGKKQPASVSINDSSLKTKILENEESLIDTAVSSSYRDPRPIQEIRREAGRYARLLDGDERWLGKLVNCVKQYPPHIRRLAAIGTLSRLYGPEGRGQLQHPGAWFCRTCERFAQSPQIVPESVQQWAATNLDDEKIAAALQQGYPAPGAQSELFTSSRQATHSSTSHPDPTGSTGGYGEHQTSGKRSAQRQAGMDQRMAEHLQARIEREVREGSAVGAQGQVISGQHTGTWMVVLTWEDGIEVLLENEAEWVSYWTGVQETVALQQRYGYV